MADNLELGKLVPPEVDYRDAIHIAVMPVIISETMEWPTPGTPVCFEVGSREVVRECRAEDYNDFPKTAIGILDPFFDGRMTPGDRVWMFLKPNTVNGMRHRWTHPVVDSPPEDLSDPKEWIAAWCQKWDFNYDEVMEVCASGASDPGEWGRWITRRGRDLHDVEELGDMTEFWEKMRQALGREVEDKDGIGWSCSC